MNDPANYRRFNETLIKWQDLHRKQIGSGTHKPPSWSPAYRLIASAKSLDRDARQQLGRALKISNRHFSPLRDPLDLNVGQHRWLSADREESYSDWLAWILQGMQRAAEILRLFGMENEIASKLLGEAYDIRREQVSKYGRTDIEVHFRHKGLLLIEVKIRPPIDLASQLRRYSDRAVELDLPMQLFAFLAPEEPTEQLDNFVFTSWRVLCQRLRNYACALKESDLMRAAAILIFCGAAEQNLLGFSVHPKRFRAAPTLEYLLKWKNES